LVERFERVVQEARRHVGSIPVDEMEKDEHPDNIALQSSVVYTFKNILERAAAGEFNKLKLDDVDPIIKTQINFARLLGAGYDPLVTIGTSLVIRESRCAQADGRYA
jgi:hypothetical protein